MHTNHKWSSFNKVINQAVKFFYKSQLNVKKTKNIACNRFLIFIFALSKK